MRKSLYTLLFMCLTTFNMSAQDVSSSQAKIIQSPNGLLSLSFDIDNGRPVYQLIYKKKMVVKPSYLGL